MVMRRKPESIESMDHATFNTKAAVAERNGALGMIVFTDPNYPDDRRGRGEGDFRSDFTLFQEPVEEDDEMRNQFRRVIESSDSFASVQVDPQIIDSLFPNHSLQDIQEALDKGTSPAEFIITESMVSMGWTESEKVDTKEVPNVVGMIEGVDPNLKNELVIVGAHYDHLGAFEGQGDVVSMGLMTMLLEHLPYLNWRDFFRRASNLNEPSFLWLFQLKNWVCLGQKPSPNRLIWILLPS